jgi:kumamolisin
LAASLVLAAVPASAAAAGTRLAGSVPPAVGRAALVSHHGAALQVTLILKRGLSDAQVASVETYMQAQGFITVRKLVHNAGLRFRGDVAQVERTFSTTINDYQRSGRTFYANATPIGIPQPIAPYVAGVVDLDNAVRALPLLSEPSILAPSGQTTPPYTPSQLRHFYNLDALTANGGSQPADGAGQRIGIITFATFSLADVRAFESTFGLPPATINVTVAPPLNGAGPGTDAGGREETTLDVTWSSAMAPGAEIDVVEAANGDWVGAFNSMAGYQPNVISMSWGACDKDVDATTQDALNAALDALNLNVPMLVASGDDGSRGCTREGDSSSVSASWPATDPHITAVGGTRLDPDALGNPQYGNLGSEVAWHCGLTAGGCGAGFASSGGGFSNHFSAPGWQSSITIADHSDTLCEAPPCRGVPDMALLADAATGYQLRFAGAWHQIGGTSAATPALAGLLATVNQALGANFDGSFNSQMYGLAGGGSSPFHDIGPGFSNEDYVTAAGWDAVTGLGSVDARLLYAAIHGSAPPPAGAPAVATGTLDDKSQDIAYTAGWGLCVTGPCAQGLNHTLHLTNTPGDTATIQFSGTGITLIYATNFDGGTGTVTIDGSAPASNASIDEQSSDNAFHAGQMVTYSGLGSGTHTLVLTFASGGTLYLDGFALLPVVASISRHSGPSLPTTAMPVRISGRGFTGATEVDFGQAAVTSFVSHSDTSITVTLPPQFSGDPGVVDVTVASPAGRSALIPADRFSYAPVVTRINPKGGPASSSSAVTVLGSNMAGADGVCFGLPSGNSLGSCASLGSGFTTAAGEVRAIPPNGAGLQSVPVLVHGPGGWSDPTAAPIYSYAPLPASISPNFGPASGTGPAVTIRGLNLGGADAVCFAPLTGGSCPSGAQSTSITPSTTSPDTAFTVQPPAGTGVQPVLVHNAGGWSAAVAALSYSYAPVVASISPSRGPQGTTVTIKGKNFTGATEVDFGSARCLVGTSCSATVASDTTMTLAAPGSGLPPNENSVSRGAVFVVVRGPGGASAANPKLEFGYTG